MKLGALPVSTCSGPHSYSRPVKDMNNYSKSNSNLKISALSTDSPVFLNSDVRRSKDSILKDRIRSFIHSKGKSESDFYRGLGYSRQVWYAISWGIWEPTVEHKVRIAVALGIDSSVLWNIQAEERSGDSNGRS